MASGTVCTVTPIGFNASDKLVDQIRDMSKVRCILRPP